MRRSTSRIKELMRVVDEYIPEPVREVDKPFMMPIEDVFSIKGRGTVVTGRVDRGRIKVGEPVEIVGLQEKSMASVVTGVEMFHKSLDEGMAGDNCGLLLRGIERTDVERGMVVAKPKSITPHKRFMSEVYVLKQGRRRAAQGVLHRVPAAVLHPDDGCDREHQAAGRGGDGDAG